MLNGDPEPFYSRLSVLAIEAAMAQGKDREAADWLDRLETGHHRDSIYPAMVYLRGMLEAKAGHAQRAEQARKRSKRRTITFTKSAPKWRLSISMSRPIR